MTNEQFFALYQNAPDETLLTKEQRTWYNGILMVLRGAEAMQGGKDYKEKPYKNAIKALNEATTMAIKVGLDENTVRILKRETARLKEIVKEHATA